MVIFAVMARIMAIDYGTKRVGIAVTDPGKIIATGLTTVARKEVIKFIENYLLKEKVECFVIGDPGMGTRNQLIAKEADRFSEELRKKFPDVKVDRMNEMFTSKMAFQTMIDSGLKKMDRRNKALIDEISATIILQNYLEKIQK